MNKNDIHLKIEIFYFVIKSTTTYKSIPCTREGMMQRWRRPIKKKTIKRRILQPNNNSIHCVKK